MKVPLIISRSVPQPLKNIYHLGNAVFANILYGFPARTLKVIGVTGTDGKTTTTQLIARILEEAGAKVAVASTINFRVAGKEEFNASKFTTLSSYKTQAFLRRAVKAGCQYAVLETSSHALDQNRIWGVPYAIAVITNVTHEHLDYHKTMAGYRRAKLRLFERAASYVINKDMEEPEYFQIDQTKPAIYYSTKDPSAHILAENIEIEFQKTAFTVEGVRIYLRLPALFNIENALAALGVAKLLNIDFLSAKSALEAVEGIPGRMEVITTPAKVDVIVDYAQTPQAFENLYAAVLPLKIPGSKIIHVFGAAGGRDRTKRPIIGEIASSHADIVILTNDEPYYEDAEKILDDIEKGVTKKKDRDYFRIPDRRLAIRKALELAEIGDIVLLTGMGAEDSLAFGDERIPWNDRQVVEEESQKLNKSFDENVTHDNLKAK